MPALVGLDLGTSSFRAVELDRSRKETKLIKIGSYENPKLNLESLSKDSLSAYSDAIKNFFSEVAFTTSNVIVGLKEKNVYMRLITLPEIPEKDVKKTINYEIEQYIPLPRPEISYSFQKLDSNTNDKGTVNWQIVAARKAVLEKYVTMLKKAGLTPYAIEPETLALGRSLGDSVDTPLGTTIIDIGYETSLIVISHRGFVRFTRSVPIGGNLITKTIQQNLGLDFAQAEEYKKVYGLDQSQAGGKIYNVVKPLVDSIISEVVRANVFFTKQNPGATIKKVIVSGGTAQMTNLLVYTASNLDAEVEIANPFKKIQINPKDISANTIVSQQQPLFSIAAGLALRETK